MAIKKFLPTKDCSVYSKNPDVNYGLDEILEIGLSNLDNSITHSLISFDTSAISSFINTLSGSVDVKLKLYFCDAKTIPSQYSLQLKQLKDDNWISGTGNKDGISYTQYSGSYLSGSSLVNEQSFSVYSSKDVVFSLSGSNLYSYAINVKNDTILLNDYSFTLQYYSKDTHTIYQPQVEVRYDDSTYDNSLSGSVIQKEPFISIINNKYPLYIDNKYRLDISCREKFPTRQFSNTANFNRKKYLPQTTYYALRDIKGDFYVVDFDTQYTKISLDQNGNFINLDTSAMEPNRYYTLDIKTIIGNKTYIFKDNVHFRINQ